MAATDLGLAPRRAQLGGSGTAARAATAGSRSPLLRFALIGAIFGGCQFILLMIGWAAVAVIDVSRAYVTTEALYSQAQKAAVLDLYRYLGSRRAEDYEKFQRALAVPEGQQAARATLEQADPDLAAADQGFRDGGNDPRDVAGLVEAFLWLQAWPPFATAIEDWRGSDRLIVELRAFGEQIHSLIEEHHQPERAQALLQAVDAVDHDLTMRESAFALHMGEAARLIRNGAVLGLGLGSLLLWTAGLRLVWLVYKRGAAAERDLRSSEQRFRDFAEVASDWFWETDIGLRFSYTSERLPKVAGGAPSLTGDAIPPSGGSDAEAWRDHFDDLQAHRDFRDFRQGYWREDGTPQYWSLSGKAVFDAAGRFTGYRGTGRDVSTEVQALEALRLARDQAEGANRAKSSFLANMSHELRTPLNAIIGFSEIIKEEIFGPVENRRYIGYAADVHDAGHHLLSLINDVLDLSKIEAGKGEIESTRMNLLEVIEWAVSLTRQRMQDHQLTSRIETKVKRLDVLADERRMRQIVLNLLSNAIKFTPPGGSITISLRRDATLGVIVAVQDTGVGIAAADIARALSPFDQIDNGLNRKFDGTGLGLPLAKSIVELHQGSLTLDSEPGVGTTVSFTLPRERLLG